MKYYKGVAYFTEFFREPKILKAKTLSKETNGATNQKHFSYSFYSLFSWTKLITNWVELDFIA